MSYQHTNSRGVTYHLRKTRVYPRGGKPQTIYFFTKNLDGKGEPCDMPDGYEVFENSQNGFLTLRKKGA